MYMIHVTDLARNRDASMTARSGCSVTIAAKTMFTASPSRRVSLLRHHFADDTECGADCAPRRYDGFAHHLRPWDR